MYISAEKSTFFTFNPSQKKIEKLVFEFKLSKLEVLESIKMHRFSIVQKLTCAKKHENAAKIVLIFLHLTRLTCDGLLFFYRNIYDELNVKK